MAESSGRKSRRQAGLSALAPPSPSVAGKGTTIRSLLATDSRNGKPYYFVGSQKSWQLDGTAETATQDDDEEDANGSVQFLRKTTICRSLCVVFVLSSGISVR